MDKIKPCFNIARIVFDTSQPDCLSLVWSIAAPYPPPPSVINLAFKRDHSAALMLPHATRAILFPTLNSRERERERWCRWLNPIFFYFIMMTEHWLILVEVLSGISNFDGLHNDAWLSSSKRYLRVMVFKPPADRRLTSPDDLFFSLSY